MLYRAEQLKQAQTIQPEDTSKRSNKGGSFFKKKTARRAKSLGKDHWDDVVFGQFWFIEFIINLSTSGYKSDFKNTWFTEIFVLKLEHVSCYWPNTFIEILKVLLFCATQQEVKKEVIRVSLSV